MSIREDVWEGCYSEGWKGILVTEAYQHPAKFSRALIQRIYQHAREEGWLAPGQTVLDPFAGVCCGAFDALGQGIRWIGVELEPRFITLAKQNIEYWRQRWGLTGATIIQGDSRSLPMLLEKLGCCLSSPPYGEQQVGTGANGRTGWRGYTDFGGGTQADEAQLASMPMGTVDACLASPPYIDTVNSSSHGIDWSKAGPATGNRKRGVGSKNEETLRAQLAYGQTSGQMGGMASGSVDAVISSPAYGGNEKSDYLLSADGKTRRRDEKRGYTQGHGCFRGRETYGQEPGNMGGMASGSVDLAISSPPYADGCDQKGTDAHPERMRGTRTGYLQKDLHRYGTTEGQLADMTISSPPYAGSTTVDGRAITDAQTHMRPIGKMSDLQHGYGKTEGQLADMTVSSPPYEASWHDPRSVNWEERCRKAGVPDEQIKRYGNGRGMQLNAQSYGSSQGQMGESQGETFWEAARQVLASTYALLRDGGHAIFVVKRYVRDGQIVEFSRDWVRLCESVGFELLHWHKAMLVETHTEQGLFGEPVAMYHKSKKSFFRRLAENRGSPRVDWEDIVCLRKRSTP
jgi:hypothetical protein